MPDGDYALGVESGVPLSGRFPRNPERPGYHFDGWLDNSTNTQYTSVAAITKTVTLTAQWHKVDPVTVIFMVNGETLKTVTADSGTIIGERMPTNPTMQRHAFVGWFDENGEEHTMTPATAITKNVTLSARWREVPEYTVSFNANGGTPTPGRVEIDSGLALGSRMPPSPTKADVFFSGWFDGETRYTNATIITKTVTLNAAYDNRIRDVRDGKTYTPKKMPDGKWWMAENLNYIPNSGNSWCYNNDNTKCAQYGRLYDWETAKAACPAGWHLPDTAEWMGLTEAVGGTSGKHGASGVAAENLKTTSGWNKRSNGESGNGKDTYGFSALPAGVKYGASSAEYGYVGFGKLGDETGWWTNTLWYSSSPFVIVVYGAGGSGAYTSGTDAGYSVRCILD